MANIWELVVLQLVPYRRERNRTAQLGFGRGAAGVQSRGKAENHKKRQRSFFSQVLVGNWSGGEAKAIVG